MERPFRAGGPQSASCFTIYCPVSARSWFLALRTQKLTSQTATCSCRLGRSFNMPTGGVIRAKAGLVSLAFGSFGDRDMPQVTFHTSRSSSLHV